tara:strand:- start:7044 stop:7793 length:750 start_codon:yes stop_codon:yes gene_type:complete
MKCFRVISIFPELFAQFKQLGIVGRAIEQGIIDLQLINPRNFTESKYKAVDNKPYGGGPGMIMTVDIMVNAIKHAKASCNYNKDDSKVIYLSPQGKLLKQHYIANEIKNVKNFIFIAGRYEGIDERIIDDYVDEEWSIGDYILTGGEVPAMVAMEALTRLIPGVLNHDDSAALDSFSTGLLDYPSYTKPIDFEGNLVPEVLLSGNHQKIASWRKKKALGRTWERRADLLEQYDLNEEEKDLLEEYKSEL